LFCIFALGSLSRNDYYAFGKRHANPGLPVGDDTRNRWLYNGKERQTTGNVGFFDYGARMYDPEIARWTTVDPLAEKYYSDSPYVYVGNNPISRIDPDGKKWVDVNGNVVWSNGQYTQYATADHRRIGDNLRRTGTGWEQFEKLVNHEKPIRTSINTTDERMQPVNRRVYGVTVMDIRDNGIWSKAEIILYEKNLDTRAEKNGTSIEDEMSATFGHEIEHTTDESVQKYIANDNYEAGPLRIGAAIMEEYEMQKPIVPQGDHLDIIQRLKDWNKK
jgi:RHS repeat-associated protein